MKFVINDEIFHAEIEKWPEGSTFRFMYEGNIEVDELRLNNSGMSRESILLVVDVILRDIDTKPLDPDMVNWNNLLYTIEYLGIGVSVDFIYPLFLTPQDRKDWYDTCELRRSYLCNYSEEEEGKLIEIHRDEMKTREPDYNIIGKDAFSGPEYYRHDDDLAEEIIHSLSHIPRLFVAGGYPLTKFDNFERSWNDIDIFAYGPNSKDHIIEGVKVCLDILKSKSGRSDLLNINHHSDVPIRTKYSITIPIKRNKVVIQFILIESKSPFHILNRFDIDASCIGFDIFNSDRFYSLPRFVRAFETGTNTIDPTRQSPTYIGRLIKYSHRGFDIAVPGFNSDNLKLSPEVLRIMSTKDYYWSKYDIRELNFVGLQALVMSSIIKSNITKFFKTNSDYNCLSASIGLPVILRMNWDKHGKDSLFIVADVLNEGQREYKFVMSDIHEGVNNQKVSYTPKYPLIELMEDDPQNGMIGSIHQVKTSFYGGYYGAKPEFIRKTVSPRRSFRSRSPSKSPIKHPLLLKPSFFQTKYPQSSFSRIKSPSRTKSPQSSFFRTKSPSRTKPSQSSFSRTKFPSRTKPSQSSFSRTKFPSRTKHPQSSFSRTKSPSRTKPLQSSFPHRTRTKFSLRPKIKSALSPPKNLRSKSPPKSVTFSKQ
uniref:Ankyrin repeat protein n=1 Tax=Pithovirus LCPAC403 TaxID=2506596 RepID=A0A481ZAJ9_9VIRU|nr:MAG: ankyrin repeat protein [Pithovirus LCPAC403]